MFFILKNTKFFLYLLVFCVLSQSFVYSAFTNNRSFNTRAKGMGSAFTAVANDSGALIYNVAGLGQVNFYDVYFLYSKWYYDLEGVELTSNYASFIYPLPKLGSFGLNYSKFEDKDLYFEDNISLSYGKEVFTNFYAGLGLSSLSHGYKKDKLQNQSDPVFANGDSKQVFGANLGLLYNRKPFSFGFSANNINKPDIGLKDKDPVPADYRVGVAFQYQNIVVPMDIYYRDQDWGEDFKYNLGYAFGLEYWLNHLVGLRAGFNRNEFSAGFSFLKNKIFSNVDSGLEYSLAIPRELEDNMGTHQLAIFFRFGEVANSGFEFAKNRLKFYKYEKIHPKFSIVQGFSSYSGSVADLFFDGKFVYRFYATINEQEPYYRALDFAKSLSQLMKYFAIKDQDVNIVKIKGVNVVNISDNIMVPIDQDAALAHRNPESLANEFLDNLKSFVTYNNNVPLLSKNISERIVVEQGYTSIGEIGNIFVNGNLEFTIYAKDKLGRTPYQIALAFAETLNKYIDEGISINLVSSEIAYGEYYLLIRDKRVFCINKEAEFLDMDKEELLLEYINKVLGVLLV